MEVGREERVLWETGGQRAFAEGLDVLHSPLQRILRVYSPTQHGDGLW